MNVRLGLLFLTLFALMGLNVLANEPGHTENVCSASDAKICGHIGHMTGMKPNQVSSFMAHLEVSKNIKISDVQISLHSAEKDQGASALTVKEVTPTKFKVTQALFPIAGYWEVEIKFKADGIPQQLNIPVKITP